MHTGHVSIPEDIFMGLVICFWEALPSMVPMVGNGSLAISKTDTMMLALGYSNAIQAQQTRTCSRWLLSLTVCRTAGGMV